MASKSSPDSIQIYNTHILFDASLISKPTQNLFNHTWLANHGQVELISSGRGQAWFIEYQNQQWVLRHYMRGGLVAKFNKDLYLGFDVKATRAWQEWLFLHELNKKNLPVPVPVAACVEWPFGCAAGLYRSDILLQRIEGATTLASRLEKNPLDARSWQQIGECICQFHQHNVYHADLNANNILFDADDKIYLIDFDKGCIRQAGDWKQDNLNRLKRSLLKLQANAEQFYFNDADWQQLLSAYEASCVA